MIKERKPDMCPKCYLQDGIDEALQYRLGSTQPLRCGREHVYEDREELSNLTRTMNEQKKAKEPPKPPAPPVQPLEVAKDITDPIDAAGVSALKLTPVDVTRMTQLIGHFTDSSSLFGAVFALHQALQDTKELLARAEAAQKVRGTGSGPGTVRGVGGDAVIQLVIPERHVEPIKDIAEANGMDITRYMNAKVEDGLDCQWYY
jgi:hypothetical protein